MMYIKTIFLLVILLVASTQVHAYLDPGSGSIIFQSLMAAGLFVAATFGIFWNHLKTFFNKLLWWKKSDEINEDRIQDKVEKDE